MARIFLALVVLIALLAHQAASQPSFSVTLTGSPSGTSPPTTSNSATPPPSSTGAPTPSNSVTPAASSSPSPSSAATRSVTVSPSSSVSVSVSPSNTITPPPAPVNVVNRCQGHIVNICPSWSNPPGITYASFLVNFTSTSGGGSFVTSLTSGRVTNLQPNTAYTFVIIGITAGGLRSLPSTPVTFTTDPTDPKLDPTKDINNIVCVSATNSANNRKVINCTWSPAAEALTRLVIKWRCVSIIREYDSNKKRLYGTKAQATSITLYVNRDVATCSVFFHAYYVRRPASRTFLTVVMSN